MTNPKDLVGIKKVPLWLLPPPAMIHQAMVHKNGADKYGPYNWRDERIQLSNYVSAILRHMTAYVDGEDIDQDSGLHHLGHVMAGAAIVLDAMETGNLIDDRPPKGRTSELLEELKDDNT